MSIFEGNIFSGPRRGMYGPGALGILPAGAAAISTLSRWRSQFPGLPSPGSLSGATHYTTRVVSSTQQAFTFYDATGRTVLGPVTVSHRLADGAVEPAATKEVGAPPMARREGDGLLPSAPAERSASPNWLPALLVGGAILVAGGIVFAATRKAPPANRRRRRKR